MRACAADDLPIRSHIPPPVPCVHAQDAEPKEEEQGEQDEDMVDGGDDEGGADGSEQGGADTAAASEVRCCLGRFCWR